LGKRSRAASTSGRRPSSFSVSPWQRSRRWSGRTRRRHGRTVWRRV